MVFLAARGNRWRPHPGRLMDMAGGVLPRRPESQAREPAEFPAHRGRTLISVTQPVLERLLAVRRGPASPLVASRD
jgi:hypothetical protein